MTKRNINKYWPTKYRRISLTKSERKKAIMFGNNMKKIYEFIGENCDHGHNVLGNAFFEIRTRATQKYGFRISKREVRSVICHPRYIIDNFYYFAIPYKIDIIIETIFDILKDLEKNNVKLPNDLQQFTNLIIRDCFYNEQYESFKSWIADDSHPVYDIDYGLEVTLNDPNNAINDNYTYKQNLL